jgi:hypothetical protein
MRYVSCLIKHFKPCRLAQEYELKNEHSYHMTNLICMQLRTKVNTTYKTRHIR